MGELARTTREERRAPRTRTRALLLAFLLLVSAGHIGRAEEDAAGRVPLLPFGVRGLGGDDPAERREAVREGLAWLAAHQSPNGAWEAQGFGSWCNGKKQTPLLDGEGKSLYDTGVTGLALLAFLGAGYADEAGSIYADTVQRGLAWLTRIQDAEGCVGNRRSQHYIYNHAYGAAALTEAYGMTEDPRWLQAARRALSFTGKARNPGAAWRYGVRPGDDDTSAAAAAMNAVRAAWTINDAARAAGRTPPFEIDAGLRRGVLDFVERMTDPEYGRTGYIERGGQAARPEEMISRFPGDLSEATTAMALMIRIAAGQDPHASETTRKGIRTVLQMLPRWDPDNGHMDLYYWHYGATAMRQVGGAAWDTWASALDAALIPNQRHDTTLCRYLGSWDPLGPWGPDGGRVYSTAVAVLALGAARAHLARFQPPKGAEGTLRERTLLDALVDEDLDVHVRGQAMRAAARGRVPGALRALRDALHAEEPEMRAHAARAIGELEADATLALPSLTAVLGDPYEVVRIAALEALAHLGKNAASAGSRVTPLLGDPQPAVRREAARAVRTLGVKGAIPTLEGLLEDPDAEVRVASARALAALAGTTPEVTRVLIEALTSGREAAALEAVSGLEALGPAIPAEATARLVTATAGGTLPVRLRAAEALLVVGGADALRTPAGRAAKGTKALFDHAFKTKDGTVTYRALVMLGALGKTARPWLPRIADRATLDPSPQVRMAATQALGRLGAVARSTSAALHLASHDESPGVRKAAHDALGKVKPTPGSEIDGLIEALGKTPLTFRATDALVAIGSNAVSALIKALASTDDDVAGSATRVLIRIGDPAVSPLVRALESPAPSLRRRAATVLGRVDVPARRLTAAGEGLTRLLLQAPARGVPEIRGTLLRIGRPAVPSLLAAFTKGDPSAKTRVLDTLGRILPPPGDVFPTFLEGLGHTDEDVRRSAAKAIARYGPQAAEATAALEIAAGDEDASVREAALRALGNVGRAADGALPLIVQALKDDEERVAAAAGRALTCLDRVTLDVSAFGSLDSILSDLGSANTQARRAAAAALVLLGANAAPASERLVSATADTDATVREWAAMALARQGKPGAAALEGVLKSGSATAREAAIVALGQMGPSAVGAVPTLIEALAMARLRQKAARTLGQIGKPAVGKLARALQDKRAPVREGAARALARIGEDAGASRSALVKMVKGEREKAIRQAALNALAAQGRNGINALKGLLKPPTKTGVRRAAAETLGALGLDARSTLSTLKSAHRREKNARVKEAMAAALVRIENGEGSTLVAPPTTEGCDRRWHYLDETLPNGVDSRVEALLVFDGSAASLEDRAQRAFDLIPARGSVQYIVEPTSGRVGLDLEDAAMLVTGEVPRNLISRGAFTIEILLRSEDPEGLLVAVGGPGESAETNAPWILRMVKGKFEAIHEVEEGQDIVAPFDLPPSDELRLLTLTRDGFGLVYHLYVNGNAVGSMRVEKGPEFAEGDKFFYVGPLKGVFLAIRVTGKAFSPAQVREAYERTRRP